MLRVNGSWPFSFCISDRKSYGALLMGFWLLESILSYIYLLMFSSEFPFFFFFLYIPLQCWNWGNSNKTCKTYREHILLPSSWKITLLGGSLRVSHMKAPFPFIQKAWIDASRERPTDRGQWLHTKLTALPV